MKQEEIELHIATLRTAYDPESPFRGLVNVKADLMKLPLDDQHQLFNALPEDLKALMFNAPEEVKSDG